jgi:hypothetical protein
VQSRGRLKPRLDADTSASRVELPFDRPSSASAVTCSRFAGATLSILVRTPQETSAAVDSGTVGIRAPREEFAALGEGKEEQ